MRRFALGATLCVAMALAFASRVPAQTIVGPGALPTPDSSPIASDLFVGLHDSKTVAFNFSQIGPLLSNVPITALIGFPSPGPTDTAGVPFVHVTGPPASVLLPAVTATPVSLSTACSTPTTPTNCASTSYAIFSLGTGAAGYSYQINAINGATIGFYSSDDGVNFFAANLGVSGSSPSSESYAASTTTTGKFSGSGAESAYVAVVMTTAGAGAVSITPYLSSHVARISIGGSVPLSLTPIGVGQVFAVPTPSGSASPAPLGSPPANATSFAFIFASGQSVTYTFAASQSAAATLCTGTPVLAITTTPNSATTGDVIWPDNTVLGTLPVWICSVTGNARARYL